MSVVTLTAEQIRRMEENKQKALQKKEEKKEQAATTSSSSSAASYKPNNNQITQGKCVPFVDDPENRFEVRTGYHQGLIDLFKTIVGRKYDPNTKCWNFPMKSYTELMLKINNQLKDKVKIEPLESMSKSAKQKTIAKCSLIDRKRFEVTASFNSELQDVFKSLPTKRYDPQTKTWSFELKDYDKLIGLVSEKLQNSVTIVPLPKVVRQIFKDHIEGNYRERFTNMIEMDELKSRIDENIVKNLLPFQADGIRFAISLNGRILLADDMGLGKTVQALAIADYYKDEWPLFVIAPSSVKFMWKESAKKWLPNTLTEFSKKTSVNVDDLIQVLENGRQGISVNSKIVVCSYDLLTRNVDEINQFGFKVIIADECHFLKNAKAVRTKSALKLFETCTRVICLSGTPALSRPAELFSQIHAVNPTLFTQFHEFGMRYCDGKESKFGMDYSGASNMKELQLVLEEKVMIRREKKEVITQLPNKVREMVILDPTLIELNKKSLQEASKLMKNEKLKGMEKRGALLAYFQETNHVKSKAVCEYINDLLESGKKFIVFAHHKSMLDAIQSECEKNNHQYIRIDGSTNSERRKFVVDKFQHEEECKIAILSITAANSGITLTEANLVLFAELFWNPGILVQAEDRVYRIGQRNSVIVQYLCAKGTADDYIWPLVNTKLAVLGKAGLTKENLSEASTVDKFAPTTSEGSNKSTTNLELDFDDIENSIIEDIINFNCNDKSPVKQKSNNIKTMFENKAAKDGKDYIPPSKKPKPSN